MTKPAKWVCAQWRLRSESLPSAWRNIVSLATHWAHSKDSIQTGRTPRLIWIFAGRTVILLVLSRGGSYLSFSAYEGRGSNWIKQSTGSNLNIYLFGGLLQTEFVDILIYFHESQLSQTTSGGSLCFLPDKQFSILAQTTEAYRYLVLLGLIATFRLCVYRFVQFVSNIFACVCRHPKDLKVQIYLTK